MTPVSLRVHISKFQMILYTKFDTCYRICDLTSNELFTTTLGFMIEKNSGACIQIITLSVVLCDPVSIQFCYSVWRTWIEWSCLCLRNCLNQTKHLTCRSLIKSCFRFYCTNCFKHIGNTKSIDICCCQRLLPTCSYKRLSSKVVNFICLRNLHCCDQRNRVRHICINKVNFIFDMLYVSIIYNALTAHDSIYFIALLQQKFCKIRTVLSCNSCNQCNLSHRYNSSFDYSCFQFPLYCVTRMSMCSFVLLMVQPYVKVIHIMASQFYCFCIT